MRIYCFFTAFPISYDIITYICTSLIKTYTMNNLLIFGLGTGEIILIVLAFLLLFGAKRIPELMKSMGKGVKNFKEGMKEVEKEINTPDEPTTKE